MLDYHYDDDYLKIFVNGENWIEGDPENLDLLINSLSNGMGHLEYENSKVGEELVISEDSGPEWIEWISLTLNKLLHGFVTHFNYFSFQKSV